MDDVDVVSLKACLKTLSESLTTTKEEDILKNLNNTAILKTDAKENLISAINILLSKYQDLEELIQNYNFIADQISRYQDLGNKITKLKQSISNERSQEEPDYSYISSLQSSITAYEKERKELKKSIDESI